MEKLTIVREKLENSLLPEKSDEEFIDRFLLELVGWVKNGDG